MENEEEDKAEEGVKEGVQEEDKPKFDKVEALLNPDASPEDMPASIRRLMERQEDNDKRIKKAIKKTKTNPKWFVPIFAALLVIGLAWVVVNYVTSGQYPIPAIKSWNLLIGFGLMFIGFVMTMWWK
ncbi:MAG: cell division protein CrgA [Aeriscardovia sp.]|nr:cell division protein CrgA [Aeriscardovia sp.]MBO6019153.1 cell division protein CrgA [Aeriscardovia sp.]MBO6071352.1 cell division protein CrgA [Aeriscardovia sp.]MBO7717445.1 cell division protein CrgA [Aeriscardovia sp.]